MQDEFFGPILAITKVPDLETALKVANDTRYALTGGIFSRNPKTIERFKHGFEVGNLYINRKITGAEVDRQPFGGFKLSGIGAKAGGPDYLKQFMVPRTITENTLRHGFSPDDLDALVAVTTRRLGVVLNRLHLLGGDLSSFTNSTLPNCSAIRSISSVSC